MPAPVTASATVAIEPERMNDMTRKVTKNISAVPKSLMSASAMTQTAEKPMKTIRFLVLNSLSSVAAPTYIYATFTNSDG